MDNTVNTEKIWKDYRITKDACLREKLILHYAPVVKYVAGRVSINVGQHVDYEDLLSYGIFGLIDAIEKFDLDKGVKFETYASMRVRGAIIDSIRQLDWVPRTLRQRNKLLENTLKELEFELGREPSDEEIAVKLNITVEEVYEMYRKAMVISMISLDDYLDQNHDIYSLEPGNAEVENPEVQLSQQEVKQMLVDAIDKLSEKEKKVISLYYFEEMTLKEISHIMNVSESRISQIHSKAVIRLQNKLERYKSLLFNP